MASNRAAKLAETLKKKLSEIIHRELKDPRIGFITITNVKVTPDLRYVTAYFSIFGDERAKKSALIGLQRATGFIKRLISREIKIRFMPEIIFKFDDTHEQEQRVNELLERIKREDEERNKRGNKGLKKA